MTLKARCTYVSIALLSIMSFCSCGKNTTASPSPLSESVALANSSNSVSASAISTRTTTTIITGSDFLPLNVGRQWILKHEVYPSRITTITVQPNNKIYFYKNHPDTYHGFRNTNLLWSVTDNGKWIHGGDETDSINAEPDDIRYDRTTNKATVSTWLQSTTQGLPPCILIPSGMFKVPSESHSTFRYFSKYDNGWEGWAPSGDWYVRWDLIDANTLRIRFDETYPTDPSIHVYEDWILRKGYGIIAIAQWNDSARTSLIRRVKM